MKTNLRLKILQEKIASSGLDGFISFNPSNIFYLTGVAAENTFVFVTTKKIDLVVSEINYLSAKKYANCKIQIAGDEFFRRYKNKKIGFDNGISVARLEKFKKIKHAKLESCSGFIENLRLIKDKSEISKIKTACMISKRTIEFAEKKIKVGVGEKELADELEYFLRKNGAEKSAFDTIVASGKDSANPHHKPTNRKFQRNDVVLVDLGCSYCGYSSDLTRTYFLGKIEKCRKKVFEIVKQAQEKAIQILKDGVVCRKVDFTARNFIGKNGFGKYFIHSTGHGVGIDIHEGPVLSGKSDTILKEGMVVTVEPGVYIPGKFGVRIEDTVLITKDGCEVLTK